MVKVFKAQPNHAGHEVPDMLIVADETIPELPGLSLAEARFIYHHQASAVVDALSATLPQGVMDCILTLLLMRRGLSDFRIVTDVYAKKEIENGTEK